MTKAELDNWICERLRIRAENYIKDAKGCVELNKTTDLNWDDCGNDKLSYARFCLNLAKHIEQGIQEF